MTARAIAGALLVAALVACAGDPVALGPREPVAYDARDRIDYTVTECGAQALVLIPIMTNDRVGRAMALIEERAGDRYIANVRLRERWTWLVFGEIYCTDIVAATYGRASPP